MPAVWLLHCSQQAPQGVLRLSGGPPEAAARRGRHPAKGPPEAIFRDTPVIMRPKSTYVELWEGCREVPQKVNA